MTEATHVIAFDKRPGCPVFGCHRKPRRNHPFSRKLRGPFCIKHYHLWRRGEVDFVIWEVVDGEPPKATAENWDAWLMGLMIQQQADGLLS